MHIDGVLSRSCVRPVSTVAASEKIVTIEGLSPAGRQPLQQAWVKPDVPRCGFRQSGMLMTAAALMKTNPRPTEKDVREAMSNICRCGTYNRVQAAILMATSATPAAKA